MPNKKKLTDLNPGWAIGVSADGQTEILREADLSDSAVGDVQEVYDTLIDKALLVPLEKIQPNPYQPRQWEDPDVLADMALSIYRDGLRQKPEARAINGHFELAYGHTRKAAFELLSSTGLPEHGILPDPTFAFMPLYPRVLSDRKMFEYALIENMKRNQLNIIEQATSMKIYLTEFGASSREAGELFGISDATVRGTVRLLNLPAAVQQKIASGEITQGAARKLLSVARIAPGDVVQIAEAIAEGDDPDGTIGSSLRNNKDVVVMWEAWRHEKEARAGDGLWLLDAAPLAESLLKLKYKDVDKAMGIELTDEARKKITQNLAALKLNADASLPARLSDASPDEADIIERIALLLRPPACSACPFHIVSNGSHLCGFKACHARKRQAWVAAELQTLSDKLGIAIYDRAADGKAHVALCENNWEDDYKKHDKLVEEKSPDLRLIQLGKNAEHKWTKSPIVAIVLIGVEAQQIVDERQLNAASQKTDYEKQQQEWKLQQARIGSARKFYRDYVPALFASAFDSMDNIAAMCALAQCPMPKDNANRSAKLATLRIALANRAIEPSIRDKLHGGPVVLAKHLKGVAVTWGVKLPADILDIAKQYEPVSVETPAKTKPRKGE